MTPGDALRTALEVRRGRVTLASLPADDAVQVAQTLRAVSDVQLARIARAQESPRGRYRLRA